jgi:hypothetical protein
VKDWKTTAAGVAKALATIGTAASALTNQPAWVTATGVLLVAVAQFVGGLVSADAAPKGAAS